MASIVFYEKPGCINNARQKKILLAAGHQIEARNLLTEQWDHVLLARFFEGMPVELWFNNSAPDIKSGKINPSVLDETAALKLMISKPILIRRPLMRVGDKYLAGFETEQVNQWIGPGICDEASDLETCLKTEGRNCRDSMAPI